MIETIKKASSSKGILIGFSVFLALVLLFQIGLFNTWQNRLSDTLFTDRSPIQDIVIIAIDDKSIQEIGRFPWDRSVYANLLNTLNTPDSSPKVIGFDISFFEASDGSNDKELADAISKMESTKVILASELNGSNLIRPIESLRNISSNGFVNTIADIDGITRRVQLWNSDINHFSLEVAKNYAPSNLPQERIIRINYVGSPNTFPTYSFAEVLDGRVKNNLFKNKIVLIGSTAPNLHDDQAVPISAKMSGVEIQANIINTILEGNALINESKIVTLITIFLVSIFGSILFTFLSPVAVAFVILIFCLLYIFYVIFSFDQGTIRNIIYPIITAIVIGISNIIYKYFTESQAKKFIRKTFSYYLSESVLSHLLENPEKIRLGGERKELTVLFSDIAGFTSMSEKMDPEDLVHVLNKYLTRMTDIVFKYEGVLDKYIGDAVMAFWGAPIANSNHALLACKAALEMQEAVGDFDFDVRIGINSGEMVVGNMGSNQRFDYTLMGDNVNLGSRLEGINKLYGTNICISENTYKLVRDKVIARKIDIVAVKGKAEGVAIYELRGIGSASHKESLFLEKFEFARSLYEKGEFKKSLKLFKDLNKKYLNDLPTLLYIDRISELVKNPPTDWQGIYRATSK